MCKNVLIISIRKHIRFIFQLIQTVKHTLLSSVFFSLALLAYMFFFLYISSSLSLVQFSCLFCLALLSSFIFSDFKICNFWRVYSLRCRNKLNACKILQTAQFPHMLFSKCCKNFSFPPIYLHR